MLSGSFNRTTGVLLIKVAPSEPPVFRDDRVMAIYELACQKSVLDAVSTRIKYLEDLIGDHEMTIEMEDARKNPTDPPHHKRW